MTYEASPRLVRAISAVLPYLVTQEDAIKRPGAVPMVYHAPLTEAQRLRRDADALDARDAAIVELRAAIKEDRLSASVRDKIADDERHLRNQVCPTCNGTKKSPAAKGYFQPPCGACNGTGLQP